MNAIVNGFNTLRQGGPVMVPLAICAILAVAVMIERALVLRRARADGEALLEGVRKALDAGDERAALAQCEAAGGPVAGLIAGGIRARHLDADGIERTMEELALRETPLLSKRLGWLDTIITVAPLLGLLGTVTGMIRAFHVVASSAGLNAPTQITGGVAEALIATATGLAIAIVTLVGYNALTERVRDIIAEMEIRATQLLNILAGLRTEVRR